MYCEIIKKMTLEEKASLCSGKDFWNTKPIERLGIPSVMVSDGPHGLRKQETEADHLGLHESIEAVCFPAACATACTFDRELIQEMGEVLGKECQAENISVLLGPAVNIKRSPLCGRNFEYFSEDPYLAGEMAAAYIQGVQSQNIGTSIKHFAANNQEHERMSGSSEVDERTLREIYFPAFEIAVKKAQPWTVMCSYNRVNGVYASENKKLLTDVLRDEWGFEGYVMSDWGAVNNRVLGLEAGLELEMPASGAENDKAIVEAVQNGTLSEDVLDKAVERILKILYKYVDNKKEEVFNRENDHKRAADIAKRSIVLLKNENNILPLSGDDSNILFVGEFAEKPRYQGGGSSNVKIHKLSNALEESAKFVTVSYAKGFDSVNDSIDENLMTEAIDKAKSASVVVVFAGLPDSFESEGYDRKHMRLPECQNKLIEEISKINSNVVVVLHNGSPVELPWVNKVSGIVEVYLGGEAVGEATASVLFGDTNPSGKLAETFPIRLEDTPCYLNFPGANQKVYYREGIFVGYRHYDSIKREVLFPFGYGLSYTTFEYSNLCIDKNPSVTDIIEVSVDVKNTGSILGREVVQLYVSDKTNATIRPEKELKGFESVELKPSETKTVTMKLDKRSFAWYSEDASDWIAKGGEYVIHVGSSSADIRLAETIQLISDEDVPFLIDANTTFGQLLENKKTREVANQIMVTYMKGMINDNLIFQAILKQLPLRSICSFGSGSSSDIEYSLECLKKVVTK